MTDRRFVLLLVTFIGALLLPVASALASAEDVLADWRKEGTIDGTYTMSELRAADARITPQEREYLYWDEAYAEAVRRLRNPDAPPTVPPRDFDDDGDIDA